MVYFKRVNFILSKYIKTKNKERNLKLPAIKMQSKVMGASEKRGKSIDNNINSCHKSNDEYIFIKQYWWIEKLTQDGQINHSIICLYNWSFGQC